MLIPFQILMDLIGSQFHNTKRSKFVNTILMSHQSIGKHDRFPECNAPNKEVHRIREDVYFLSLTDCVLSI